MARTGHFRANSLLRESLAQDFDLAERDVFEFGGTQCDGLVASVLARLSFLAESATALPHVDDAQRRFTMLDFYCTPHIISQAPIQTRAIRNRL